MNEILNDLSPATLAIAIEANQLESWADLDRCPQVEVYDGPDLMWCITHLPSPGGNVVCRARLEPACVDAKIDATLHLFTEQAVSMVWHTGPATRPADLGQRLVTHGLTHTQDEPGMAIDLWDLADASSAPSALTIERVSDLTALREWMRVFALGFGLPDPDRDAMFDIEVSLGLDQPSARRLYLGLLDSEPVATSMLFLGAGVAGIYGVSTLPHARRQGIGSAMTTKPLSEARALGYRVGILHASDMGLSVYRRLGFREYCKLSSYEWTGQIGRDVDGASVRGGKAD